MATFDLDDRPLMKRFAEDPGDVLEELRDGVPEVLPPVVDMFIGIDGSVWLALYPIEEGRPWLMLDAGDGDIVGTIIVPHHVALSAGNATHAWGTARDEYDVESVVRFRIGRNTVETPDIDP